MENSPEPWLRGTHTGVDAVLRAVVHALELAREDVVRWVFPLSEEHLGARPYGLPSAAYQVRHIARSLDRLLTYAEGNALSGAQLSALSEEAATTVDAAQLRKEFEAGIEASMRRVLRFEPAEFPQSRVVGRAGLPTTVAGLLVHVAEHTQRHVGQAITTAKLVASLQDLQQS